MTTLYHFFPHFFLLSPPPLHPADSQPSYPPFKCVKQQPHEASFAPFTPSSVGDSAPVDMLPHQSGLSLGASKPACVAHVHGPCYSQYTSQAFIAGTTSPTGQRNPPLTATKYIYFGISGGKTCQRHGSFCGSHDLFASSLTVTALFPSPHPAFHQA